MAQAANVTKYNAGGSGDNLIDNGKIRQTEKVWIDNYTIAFTNTNTTVELAVVPEGAFITSIAVVVETSASQTNGTISIGYSSDTAIDTFLKPVTITHNATSSTVVLPAAGILGAVVALTQTQSIPMGNFNTSPTNSAGTITLKLNNWTMTTGTVKSIVRYVGR